MPWQELQPGTLKHLTDNQFTTLNQPPVRCFLTGDAHRTPPFLWTEACDEVKNHFIDLMNEGRLCAHVEDFQDRVSENSVPSWLSPLHQQKKIFGWEFDVFKLIGNMTPVYIKLAQINIDYRNHLDEIVNLNESLIVMDSLLYQIGSPLFFANLLVELEPFKEYFEAFKVFNSSKKNRLLKKQFPRKKSLESEYIRFLGKYNYYGTREARDYANPFIAARLSKAMDKYPNDTHLITCGETHLKVNAIQDFIKIPNDEKGVWDSAKE